MPTIYSEGYSAIWEMWAKVIWIRSGWLRGSIYWVLLFRGRFFATKPLSQKHRSTFLPLQDANPTPSFGGFGLRKMA